MRFFNTTGPVRAADHYAIPPLTRIDLDEIMLLVQQQRYFVLHAPRQVGKTSYLLALMDYLNEQGQYTCLYINVEKAQAARENVDAAMQSILHEIGIRAHIHLADNRPETIAAHALEMAGPYNALSAILTQWTQLLAKPLILLIDEIDSLIGDTLISVLRQLRAGYDRRPHSFPQSIILCGVRDVRDYRIHSSSEKMAITGGSAFNVKAASLRLDDFARTEVEELYRQHTNETGQEFTSEAIALIWELTQGQPWLVNALGYELCFATKAVRDWSRTITAELVLDAKETLILRRETHLDQLVDKLREPRVRRVIEPILSGEGEPELIPTDDVSYVRDLGLITYRGRQLAIANPIYQEVIPRELIYTTQLTIAHETAWYLDGTGRLDMTKLLTAFQEFFRLHSAQWIERFDYKEAGPQLLLQAFLQRVINGGGRIEREYGLGRQRTDLLIFWPYGNGQRQQIVLELKIRYGELEKTIADGLAQTWRYMDTVNTTDGHLIIFDRSPNKSWNEKIFRRVTEYDSKTIIVWGM